MAHRHTLFFVPTGGSLPVEDGLVLFFAEQSSLVRRVDVDGSSNTDNWASGGSTYGCSVDEETERIYWGIFTNDAVKFSDYDGSSTTQFHTAANPSGIDVDSTYAYWGEWSNARIRKCDKTDGSSFVNLKTGLNDVRDVHVDLDNGYVVFAERAGKTVERVDLDGSNHTNIKSSSGFLYNCHADPDNDHIYYTDNTAEQIRRIDYDGTNDTLLYDAGGGSPDNQNIQGMCVDLSAGYIYWTDVIDKNIGRCDLDGGNPDKSFATAMGTYLNHIDIQYDQDTFYAKPSR